ncbi:MAG: diaminopimelate epimerase [Verrucomicrobiae bacterium]|nr:diaminopimelate epimerase [Verrucomicrobiae bacterium]
MKVAFTKMSGAGNDFILMDNRRGVLHFSKSQIATLCHRHFGVGADGLLLVEAPLNGEADFRMRYYNADGGEAEMCGNGARCFARYASQLANQDSAISFETPAGLIRASFEGDLVTINMTQPQEIELNKTITLESGSYGVHHCNTGVPHAILFVGEIEAAKVEELGREIRFHMDYQPKGTNVNFVQKLGENMIRVRTYERGVEGETLACGTGMVASAIVSHLVRKVTLPMQVKVQGGDILEVNFKQKGNTFEEVTLKGPATFVFQGEVEV